MSRLRFRLTILLLCLMWIFSVAFLSLNEPGSDSAKQTGTAPITLHDGGSEQNPKSDGLADEAPLPDVDHKTTAPATVPLTKSPVTRSQRGAIAKGFPVKVVPVINGSSVQTTGLSSTSNTVQVSITAINTKPPNAVLEFYRAKLSAIGFAETSVPSVGGAMAAGFKRKRDRLVVTVAKSASGGTKYSIFGTLRPAESR